MDPYNHFKQVIISELKYDKFMFGFDLSVKRHKK